MQSKKSSKSLLSFVTENKNMLIAVSVLVLTVATIGISYASFFTIKSDTNSHYFSTGSLIVSYGNETSSILRDTMEPTPDEVALDDSDSSLIYIQNNGNVDSTFVLNIGYDMENFMARAGYSESDRLTPLTYVKLAVYQYNGAGEEDTLIIGPISVGDLPIYEKNDTDSRYNRYSILFDDVGNNGTSNSTKTYRLKIWLSENASPAASYTYFYLNTEVVADAEKTQVKYNFSGTLKNNSNEAISGATISIQNGTVKTTTSSTGAFNLNGIRRGTYNMEIITEDHTYVGNLVVKEEVGGDGNFISGPTTFTATDIYSDAKLLGTTITKILKKNNLDLGDIAIATGSTYNLYPIYEFHGGVTPNITLITIKLNEANETFTITKN